MLKAQELRTLICGKSRNIGTWARDEPFATISREVPSNNEVIAVVRLFLITLQNKMYRYAIVGLAEVHKDSLGVSISLSDILT